MDPMHMDPMRIGVSTFESIAGIYTRGAFDFYLGVGCSAS